MARIYGVFIRKALKLSLFHGFFNGILNQMVEPLVIKGLFGSDGRLDKEFKLVMTSLTEVPMGQVEIIPVGNRLLDDLSAHVAGKGLHISLLSDLVIVLYDGVFDTRRNQSPYPV
jgi:hypothetical protein